MPPGETLSWTSVPRMRYAVEDMGPTAKNQPRVAMVTGGAKRVGRAIVERLADAGFDIAFTYLSSKKDAASLAAALKRKPRRAIAIFADLTQPITARQVAREFREEFNRLDVLVNSASLYELS